MNKVVDNKAVDAFIGGATTINTPHKKWEGENPNAKRTASKNAQLVTFNLHERYLIEAAAAKVTRSKTAFVRYCALAEAKRILGVD